MATVIMTIGLVSTAELLAITLRMQQLGRNQTAAVRLAQDKVDQLMSLNFDTATSIAIGGSLTSNVANHNDTVTGYTRRWVVAAGPVDPSSVSANLRLLTVRVIPEVQDTRTAVSYDLVTVIRRW